MENQYFKSKTLFNIKESFQNFKLDNIIKYKRVKFDNESNLVLILKNAKTPIETKILKQRSLNDIQYSIHMNHINRLKASWFKMHEVNDNKPLQEDINNFIHHYIGEILYAKITRNCLNFFIDFANKNSFNVDILYELSHKYFKIISSFKEIENFFNDNLYFNDYNVKLYETGIKLLYKYELNIKLCDLDFFKYVCNLKKTYNQQLKTILTDGLCILYYDWILKKYNKNINKIPSAIEFFELILNGYYDNDLEIDSKESQDKPNKQNTKEKEIKTVLFTDIVKKNLNIEMENLPIHKTSNKNDKIEILSYNLDNCLTFTNVINKYKHNLLEENIDNLKEVFETTTIFIETLNKFKNKLFDYMVKNNN